MVHPRYISHVESQFVNVNKSFQTILHHLTADDNGRARLEMESIMTIITQLYGTILNFDNIGRQPEEKQTLNNIKNYSDCILLASQ